MALYQMSSRGWFESDEDFEARLKAARAAWEAKVKASKKKKPAAKAPGGGGSSLPSTTKWVTPASTKKPVAKSKPKPARGGGVFAAMMMDSDSD